MRYKLLTALLLSTLTSPVALSQTSEIGTGPENTPQVTPQPAEAGLHPGRTDPRGMQRHGKQAHKGGCMMHKTGKKHQADGGQRMGHHGAHQKGHDKNGRHEAFHEEVLQRLARMEKRQALIETMLRELSATVTAAAHNTHADNKSRRRIGLTVKNISEVSAII